MLALLILNRRYKRYFLNLPVLRIRRQKVRAIPVTLHVGPPSLDLSHAPAEHLTADRAEKFYRRLNVLLNRGRGKKLPRSEAGTTRSR